MVFQKKMMKWLGAFILITLMDPALAPKEEIIMTKTDIIPRNKKEYLEYTKNINCSNGTYPHYAVSSKAKETYIVCWKETTIQGFCLEFNFGGNIVQPNVLADCRNYSLSPCQEHYSSIESYLIFECFQKYGGVPSPRQQKEINAKILESSEKQNNFLKGRIESKQNELYRAWVFFGISLCGNFGFILVKIIPLLRNWYTNNKGNGKTTRTEEKDQSEETKKDEPGVEDKLIEEANANDCQATSSAITVSEETKISVQEDTEPAREFHDKRAKPTIRQNFLNRVFDNVTQSP
ncbi:uncharacterized protein LOC133189028 [Saccostrea echinata]|uniref:uncharacterized protein LOC133180567 n=1 Tax=Saccostrea echinata TaxID=191078 RepID=UPI002A800D17|nr:uncharacterized protein LOC133180567 [Saccostrea echinata]XP_061180454.1 uncharacterized protein LOC133189028 [Saccostrea echinata]